MSEFESKLEALLKRSTAETAEANRRQEKLDKNTEMPAYQRSLEQYEIDCLRQRGEVDVLLEAMPSMCDHYSGGVTSKRHATTSGVASLLEATEVRTNAFKNACRLTGKGHEPKAEHTLCECGNNNVADFVQLSSDHVCKNCGRCTPVVENTLANLPYGTELEQAPFAYKRSNHFMEWIAQSNARERSAVPQEVIDGVVLEFKKHRMLSVDKVTKTTVRTFLKKLGYNKYYEHITSIVNVINRKPVKTMTPEQEEKLRVMFNAIQVPFNEVTSKLFPERKNFLSYSYVLHKFCELLGMDEFLERFPLLKSRDKLYQQDMIWKGICEKMRWQFIPSL